MENIFKILEEEKDRILEMHKIATKNQYLIEQQTSQIPTTYTVRNAQVTLKGQNKKTTAAAEDLKIFKGAKFIKQGGNIVANTKYQFLDIFGNVIDVKYGFELINKNPPKPDSGVKSKFPVKLQESTI